MTLALNLMIEAARRCRPNWAARPMLDDAQLQAGYCIDAPETVIDGVEWFTDDLEGDVCSGVVSRVVPLRHEGGAA